MRLISIVILLGVCSCTILKKDEGSDEMLKMGEMVLKTKEGLEIEFKPVPLEKK